MTSATGIPDGSRLPRAAFTLVEVVLAMGLIGLLLSLSVISFPAMLRAAESPPLEDVVADVVRQARLSAIRQGELTDVFFSEEGGSLGYENPSESGGEALGSAIKSLEFRATLGLGEPSPRPLIGPNGVLRFNTVAFETEEGEAVELPFDPLTARVLPDEDEG